MLRRVGHYDWCHPSETQACYDFTLREGAPEDCCTSYSVSMDHDGLIPADLGDVLGVAEACLQIAEQMFFSSRLDGLRKTVAFLALVCEQDEYDAARYRITEIGKKIAELTAEMERLDRSHPKG